MSTIEIAFCLLFLATLAVALVPKLKLPAEVILLLGSLAISFIPGLPEVALKPDIVFLIFLPPILFTAAFSTSWRDFKNNLRPISAHAVGLILFTMFCVAVAAKELISGMSWAQALLLGAIVAPPDASAATIITKRLGAPRRLITVIEGESLVNDATALVAYRFALTAVLTGSFSPPSAALELVWVAIGGTIIGLLVAWVSLEILGRLKDSRAETTLTLLTSFACYIGAEHLGASGVISVVVGGLYCGRKFPAIASAKTKMAAKASWETIVFIINGFIFTLIGLQLPSIMRRLIAAKEYSASELIEYALIISGVVIVSRILWVFPVAYLPRYLSASLRERDPYPSWRELSILGWTGMRGIVSLAAALALPEFLPSGQPFYDRNLLVFIVYSVILVTLLIPVFTLPVIMKWLKVKAGTEHLQEEALARVVVTEAVIVRLGELEDKKSFESELIQRFKVKFERRLLSFRSNLQPAGFSMIHTEELDLRRVSRETVDAERSALDRLRKDGKIHDEIFHAISEELNFEELRLKSPRL